MSFELAFRRQKYELFLTWPKKNLAGGYFSPLCGHFRPTMDYPPTAPPSRAQTRKYTIERARRVTPELPQSLTDTAASPRSGARHLSAPRAHRAAINSIRSDDATRRRGQSSFFVLYGDKGSFMDASPFSAAKQQKEAPRQRRRNRDKSKLGRPQGERPRAGELSRPSRNGEDAPPARQQAARTHRLGRRGTATGGARERRLSAQRPQVPPRQGRNRGVRGARGREAFCAA